MRQQPARRPRVIVDGLPLGEAVGIHELLRLGDFQYDLRVLGGHRPSRRTRGAPAWPQWRISLGRNNRKTTGVFSTEGEDFSMAEKFYGSKGPFRSGVTSSNYRCSCPSARS